MLYVLMVCFCTATAALSVLAVLRVTRPGRRRVLSDAAAPPVTVLKPLCGADEALERNLETFFLQDYPDFELLFGVEGQDDPSIPIVRRLRRRFPEVRCRLVIHDGRRALNPKVSNLRAMMETPTADIVVISDSNVAVLPGYLRGMVAELLCDGVGLVTSLIAGHGERSLGATMENLHLAGPVAGSVAASQLLGCTICVGKSMMFRRSVLERLGGMESVASVLAEDYVIGRMFHAAGYEVRLASGAVRNVCVDIPVEGFVRRHMRWGLIRSRLKPVTYPFEVLANPMAVALMAPLFGVLATWPMAWAVAVVMARDAIQWIRLRGTGGLTHALGLGPLKELVAIGIFLAAPARGVVAWRGRSYRVAAGTRLFADRPSLPPAMLDVSVP